MGNCTNFISISQKKAAFTQNLISTAHHEAGHAVYGLLHLMKIDSVHVFEDENNCINGYTNFDFFIADDFNSSSIANYVINSDICLRYAGLIAEKYHYKTVSGSDRFPMFLKDGSSDDTTMASNLIKKYKLAPPGQERQTLKDNLRSSILQELQQNWDDVNLIAHGLFQKKKLKYLDIKDLLTTQSKNKKFWRAQFKAMNIIYNNCELLDEKELRIILAKRNLL